MTIHRYPLVSRFKGERDYIHGSDILDATVAHLQANASGTISNIDIAFHRLARRAVDLVCDEQGKTMDPVAQFQYSVGGVRRGAYVVETDRVIKDRHSYPEQDIADRLVIDAPQRICTLEEDMPFTDIEIWVSMTKALHQAALSSLKGKWLFVRGRFDRYDSCSQGARTLTIVANFNNKLTRCAAVRQGAKVGEIYFSMV